VPFVTWTESLSVGDPELDEQHRGVFALVNRLSEAADAGQGREVVGETLDALLRHCERHFEAEEAHMERLQYVGLRHHREQHLSFGRQVASLRRRWENGDPIGIAALLGYLKVWLEQHIRGTDQLYAALPAEP